MLLDAAADLVQGKEPALRREEQLAGYVDRAGDMAAARAAPPDAGVLVRVAGVDDLPVEIGMVQEPGQLVGGDAQPRPGSWREDGAVHGHVARLDRTSLSLTQAFHPPSSTLTSSWP